MEACRTPKIISDHELYMLFSFTLCSRLVKYEFNSFKKGYLPRMKFTIGSSWGKQSKALERSDIKVLKGPPSSRNFFPFFNHWDQGVYYVIIFLENHIDI